MAGVAVLLVLAGCGAGAGDASPPASATAPMSISVGPVPSREPRLQGALQAGTYEVPRHFPIDLSLTVGDGWEMWSPVFADGFAMYHQSPSQPAGMGLVVVLIEDVFADPCEPLEGDYADIGQGVEDLLGELIAQPRTEVSEGPAPVAIDGFEGLYADIAVAGPAERCIGITRWRTDWMDREGESSERDQLWVLDVAGVRLVIDAFSFPGTSEQRLAELHAVVDSITIRGRRN